jgi:hypothetical protein
MNTQVLPWYRYKLVWLVIAIPAASVFAGMYLIYLATNTDHSLVVDDYYKQGMAINQNMQRDRTAAALGLSAHLVVEASGDMITLTLDKGALADYPEKLSLHFQHATHAEHDQFLTLVPAPQGQYLGYLKQSIREGVWHIVLSTPEWRLLDRVHWQNGLDISLTAQQ